MKKLFGMRSAGLLTAFLSGIVSITMVAAALLNVTPAVKTSQTPIEVTTPNVTPITNENDVSALPLPTINPALTCGRFRLLSGEEKSRNAQFVRWPNVEHAIHVLTGLFEGDDTHFIGRGQSMILGYEWEFGSVTYLDDYIINNPNHDVRVVLDGTVVPGNWKQYYQHAFEAKTQCGPNWSWDHDGDGPDDGNGNGVSDFDGPVLFWRAPLGPLSKGTYILTIEYTFDSGLTWTIIPGGTIVVR